jgi:hypothetical protein
VLIVSEETGRVSLAFEGQLTLVEDRSQLADTLRKLRGLTPDSGHTASQVAAAVSSSGVRPFPGTELPPGSTPTRPAATDEDEESAS